MYMGCYVLAKYEYVMRTDLDCTCVNGLLYSCKPKICDVKGHKLQIWCYVLAK